MKGWGAPVLRRLPERGRVLAAAGVLVAVYAVVLAMGDPRAWSVSDIGGKVATVRAMADTGNWRADVGYWAEASDPKGVHHPLYSTARVGDRWVQVTSLPFPYLGVPLWHLARQNGLLVLPVLGSLLAAVAARRLARALGAARGWLAFWLTGLASPMLFYAGDFWEHSAAVGLALLAVALLFEEGGGAKALAAGLLAGGAVVLRTEVVVYVAAFGVAVLLVEPVRRSWLARPRHLAAAVAGVAIPLLVNAVAERAVLGAGLQSTRAGAHASIAGDAVRERVNGALLTTLGVFPDRRVINYLLGGLVVSLFAVAAHVLARLRPEDPGNGRRAAAAGLGLLAIRATDGLGFVPGMLPASPAAAAGLAGPSSPRERAVVLGALLALPLVWVFQWRGQLEPQWGGRYVMLTGAFLVVVGAVALERAGLRSPVVGLLVVAAVGMSAFGAAWHVRRTSEMARAVARIEDAPDDVVVVSNLSDLGREGGAWYGDHRWLTGIGRAGLREAVGVARREGAERIDVVELEEGGRRPGPTAFVGFRPVGTRQVPFLDFTFIVRRYVAL